MKPLISRVPRHSGHDQNTGEALDWLPAETPLVGYLSATVLSLSFLTAPFYIGPCQTDPQIRILYFPG